MCHTKGASKCDHCNTGYKLNGDQCVKRSKIGILTIYFKNLHCVMKQNVIISQYLIFCIFNVIPKLLKEAQTIVTNVEIRLLWLIGIDSVVQIIECP